MALQSGYKFHDAIALLLVVSLHLRFHLGVFSRQVIQRSVFDGWTAGG